MKNKFGKIYDFKVQMAVGDKGEKDFLECYAKLGPKKSHDNKAIDFILGSGKTLELKSDSYTMEETPNFFMEVYGCLVSFKPGGPLRALQDKVDFFVYYFPKNRTFFWFNTVELCHRLNQIILSNKYKMKTIKNKGWSAGGFAIAREEFADLEIKRDTF